jgi:hypothetical protein
MAERPNRCAACGEDWAGSAEASEHMPMAAHRGGWGGSSCAVAIPWRWPPGGEYCRPCVGVALARRVLDAQGACGCAAAVVALGGGEPSRLSQAVDVFLRGGAAGTELRITLQHDTDECGAMGGGPAPPRSRPPRQLRSAAPCPRGPRLHVAPSGVAGLGLFAGEAIAGGCTLCQFSAAVEWESPEALCAAGLPFDAAVHTPHGLVGDAAFGTGVPLWYRINHAFAPHANAALRYGGPGSRTPRFVALRPLSLGDEILFDYGDVPSEYSWPG